MRWPGISRPETNRLSDASRLVLIPPAAGRSLLEGAMSALQSWPEMEFVASLGPVPPDDEHNLKLRLAMQLGGDDAGQWKPTPLGEVVTLAIVTMAVRTALPEHGTAAYVALEDAGALDRIIDGLQRSIVREVRRAAHPEPTA